MSKPNNHVWTSMDIKDLDGRKNYDTIVFMLENASLSMLARKILQIRRKNLEAQGCRPKAAVRDRQVTNETLISQY